MTMIDIIQKMTTNLFPLSMHRDKRAISSHSRKPGSVNNKKLFNFPGPGPPEGTQCMEEGDTKRSRYHPKWKKKTLLAFQSAESQAL